jgi:hypothetical protein
MSCPRRRASLATHARRGGQLWSGYPKFPSCYPCVMVSKKHVAAKLTPEQAARATEVIQKAVQNFDGTFDELESAIGMYMLGHYVGWKVLVLLHSKKTIRKYEEILQITVRDEFPEEGAESDRSRAYAIAKKLSNFWKAVSGEDKSITREERKQFG